MLEGRSRLKREIRRFVLCTIGALLMAANLKSFIQAGGLYPGGFSGITVLLQDILLEFAGVELPYTAIYIPLNLIPIIIGLKFLGK